MVIGEQIHFTGERKLLNLKRIPEWAHAEHMEMAVPLKELWKYSDAFKRKNSIISEIIRRMRGLWKMKRENVIICHSAEEMNRKADMLIEQGFHVEREVGVQPAHAICLTIYKVLFWK